MPSLFVVPGVQGGAMPRRTLGPGQSAASLLDLTTAGDRGLAAIEGRLYWRVSAAGKIAAGAVQVAAHPCYSTPVAITSNPSPTSLVLAAPLDLDPGQRVLVVAASGRCELATVVSAPGTTVAVAPLAGTYAAGDAVRLVSFSGSAVFGGLGPIATDAALDLACSLDGASPWCLLATNSDASASIVVSATCDVVQGVE